MTAVLDAEDEFSDIEAEPEPETRTTRAKAPAARRTSSRPTKRITNLKDALAKQMFMLGTMTGMAMPVTGYYICQESDQFTDAVIRLAQKDTRYIEALENFASIGPGIIIGRTVLGIGCAIGVDRWNRTEGEKGIDPGRRAAMLLGVTSAWWEVTHGDDEQDAPAPASAPPHAVFVPVT